MSAHLMTEMLAHATNRIGCGLTKPQIDASAMTVDKSSSVPQSQVEDCMRAAALAVPTRQGVHWPQLSCSKNRIVLSAASRARSAGPGGNARPVRPARSSAPRWNASSGPGRQRFQTRCGVLRGQLVLRTLMKASEGIETLPNCFIFFLPSFCLSRSLRLRVMSPP